MAKIIKVATFSVNKHCVNKTMNYIEMIEQYTRFWNEHVAKVLPDKPDLILMPEYSNIPSDGLLPEKQLEYHEAVSEKTLEFVSTTAKANNCYIVCNQLRKFDKQWYNTSTVFGRDGNECGCYRKNFLTPDEHAKDGIQYGRKAELIETDFGRLACVTCFDLNFDQLREYYNKAKPDLLLFSSMYHGGGQQVIWPWLCRCHFIGSMGFREIPGEIRNPFGEVLYSTSNYFDYSCGSINLDYKIVHLDYNLDKLDAMKEKYGSEITIYDPGQFGCVMVSSNSEQITTDEMLNIFNISDYDTYLEAAQEQRNTIK